MNKMQLPYKNKILPVFLIFIILITAFTYPWVFKMNSSICGFEDTDEPYWSLWYFWWLKYSFAHKLQADHCSIIASPFGIDFGNSLYPTSTLSNKFLTQWLGQILNYNMQIFCSLILSAVFLYFLVYAFTKSRLAAVFSGVIYSFCPYHILRIWQHFDLAKIEWLAFYLLLLYKLRESPGLKNSILAAIGLCLVSLFNWYYVYFAMMILASFVLFILIFEKEAKLKIVKFSMISGVIGILMMIPLVFPAIRASMALSPDSGEWGLFRPFENLFSQSARPLSYFLPAVMHPIFGRFTENFIGSSLYGLSLTEHTLYLGWIPLSLAFFAFRRWRISRQSSSVSSQITLSGNERFYIGFFVFLAVVAWFFSQPPWWQIGQLKIFMPSFFMYKLLPMFRAYCRFGIVVMLAVAVLAGFGLKFILDRFKSQKSKLAVTAVSCVLVLFEFWNWPPYKVIDVSRVPAVYYWLKDRPGNFTIAEYPLDAVAPDQMYRFSQTTHEKKIINDTVPWTPANDLAKTITALSEPRTAGILKWLQVKYVIVHREGYLNTGLVKDKEEFDKIPQNKGLKLIKTFPAQECPQKDIMCIQKAGSIDVYEIIATPVKPELTEK